MKRQDFSFVKIFEIVSKIKHTLLHFTSYSSASQMAAFTALCYPFRRAARFASSISGRNTRSTSLFSMMSSVES